MVNLLRLAVLVLAFAIFLQSGWVSYSGEPECAGQAPAGGMTGKEDFLAAHGLTNENYSVWLREHSVWRNQYSEELEQFTFIPQDFTTDRK